VYDAAGTKLEKRVTDPAGNITTTQYDGGYVYQDSLLQYFAHAEGYVRVGPPVSNGSSPAVYNKFDYIYQYKDHLGNVRLSYTKDVVGQIQVVEEDNYYAFGMKHKGYNNVVTSDGNAVAQKYKYNGIEFEEALGYNMYEMDARQYDPAIARWVVIDPVIYYSLSPYNAFNNNPVFWADPSGMSGVSYNLKLQDFDGKWHTVGMNDFAFGVNFQTGTVIVDGEIVDPYQGPIENTDNASTGGSGGGGFWDWLFGRKQKSVLTFEEPTIVMGDEMQYDNSSFAWALAINGGLLADDATVIGIYDDALIPAVSAIATGMWIIDNQEMLARETANIVRILDRTFLGRNGYQYALVAGTSGEYPVFTKGFVNPTGTMPLEAGDVWKYGETTTAERYTQSYLNSIGVERVPQFFGSQMQIKLVEKSKIINYLLQNGHLPPGNKISR
jgi:RHS repeat-associated protein